MDVSSGFDVALKKESIRMPTVPNSLRAVCSPNAWGKDGGLRWDVVASNIRRSGPINDRNFFRTLRAKLATMR